MHHGNFVEGKPEETNEQRDIHKDIKIIIIFVVAKGGVMSRG